MGQQKQAIKHLNNTICKFHHFLNPQIFILKLWEGFNAGTSFALQRCTTNLSQEHVEVIYGFNSKPQSYNTTTKKNWQLIIFCRETVTNWENMTLWFCPFQQPQSCEHTDIQTHCKSFSIITESVFMTKYFPTSDSHMPHPQSLASTRSHSTWCPQWH